MMNTFNENNRYAEIMQSFYVPESRLFGFKTRMVDAWIPKEEILVMPGFHVKEAEVILTTHVGKSETTAKQRTDGNESSMKKIRVSVKNFLHRSQSIYQDSEHLLYDTRNADNENIAHLIQHHLLNLIFIENRFKQSDRNREIAIILEKNNQLAFRFFNALGYKVILTNGRVQGEFVRVDVENFYSLIPLLNDYMFNGYTDETPKKVFISRRGSRYLLNESDVESYLKAQGFTKIYMEDFPLPVQWSILRNATDIVAIHGAGLGALAFNNQSRFGRTFRLTELFGSGFIVDCFRRYTAILGGQWVGCRGRIESNIIRDIDERGMNMSHAFDPFEVSISSISMALDYHDKISNC